MRKIFIIFIIFGSFITQSHAMRNKEICETRADMMYAIATERDAGKTRKQIKRIIKDKLGNNFRNSFNADVDLVFNEGKHISPKYIKIISLDSCYEEF